MWLFRRKRTKEVPQSGQTTPLIKATTGRHVFDKTIFICGLHRSGTTLVERYLRAHFDLACIDAPVSENEGQHLQDVYPAGEALGGPGRFAFSPGAAPPIPNEASAIAQRKRLEECWTPWLTHRTDTFLEKSPPNLTKIAYLRVLFPGARFIIVTRHPVATSKATQKWSYTSLEELMYHWHVAHSFALKDESDDCMRLRYEDFCEDPAGTMASLQGFLDLQEKSNSGPMDDRFSQIVNTNQTYFDRVQPRNFGPGAWDDFGYQF